MHPLLASLQLPQHAATCTPGWALQHRHQSQPTSVGPRNEASCVNEPLAIFET